MTGAQGQASAEYAALLAVAAVLGASLALIAGPPLASGLRSALAGALAASMGTSALAVPTAADVADVQSALLPGDAAVTPDAALLALERRHGKETAEALASVVLLGAARAFVPWLGRRRTYRAWIHVADGPYVSTGATADDRDVEEPTGSPTVTWVTVGDQRRAMTTATAHHTSAMAIALDLAGVVPGGGDRARCRRRGTAGARPADAAAESDRPGTQRATASSTCSTSTATRSRRACCPGDVEVAWPVHRTFWRHGRIDPAPRITLGSVTSPLTASDYWHRVYLRAAAEGSPSSPRASAHDARTPRTQTARRPASRTEEYSQMSVSMTRLTVRRAHPDGRAGTGNGRIRRHRPGRRRAARRGCRSASTTKSVARLRPHSSTSSRTPSRKSATPSIHSQSRRGACVRHAPRPGLLGDELRGGTRLRGLAAGRPDGSAPVASGRRNVNAAPPPGRSPTTIVPPMACASSEATGRPRPTPWR